MTEREEELIRLLRACKPLIVAEAKWRWGLELLERYEETVGDDAKALHQKDMTEMGYRQVGPNSWELIK